MGCSGRQGSATLLHDRVGALRLGLALVASFMLALVVAAPAMAGEARVADVGGKLTLEYEAGVGETNTVTVTQSGNTFTVADTTATVTSGAGCLGTASETTCTDPGGSPIQAIRVDLRDLDDSVVLNASLPSELLGRPGNDHLTGGDGPDTVNGNAGADTIDTVGPGRDTVLCDSEDASVAADPDDTVSGGCLPAAPAVTAGPEGATNDNTPSFTFASSPGAPVTGFECMIDPIDDGPFGCDTPYEEISELPDGPYFFRVRAVNDFGPGAWTTREFSVDTQAPQVTVSGPPSGNSAQPTFTLSSNETLASFECAIDQGAFAACSSPYTTPPLANGSYVLFVKGTDAAGNSTTTEFPFGVLVTSGGGGGGGAGAAPPAVKPAKIIIESLVLISGRAVKMSRKRQVTIGLQCAGTSTCKGRMSITTAEPVTRKSKKLERLGSTKFTIAANKRKNVKVRFSKAKAKLAKRLKRFKAKVVITEIDQRGNARISSRVFILRAR